MSLKALFLRSASSASIPLLHTHLVRVNLWACPQGAVCSMGETGLGLEGKEAGVPCGVLGGENSWAAGASRPVQEGGPLDAESASPPLPTPVLRVLLSAKKLCL